MHLPSTFLWKIILSIYFPFLSRSFNSEKLPGRSMTSNHSPKSIFLHARNLPITLGSLLSWHLKDYFTLYHIPIFITYCISSIYGIFPPLNLCGHFTICSLSFSFLPHLLKTIQTQTIFLIQLTVTAPY